MIIALAYGDISSSNFVVACCLKPIFLGTPGEDESHEGGITCAVSPINVELETEVHLQNGPAVVSVIALTRELRPPILLSLRRYVLTELLLAKSNP